VAQARWAPTGCHTWLLVVQGQVGAGTNGCRGEPTGQGSGPVGGEHFASSLGAGRHTQPLAQSTSWGYRVAVGQVPCCAILPPWLAPSQPWEPLATASPFGGAWGAPAGQVRQPAAWGCPLAMPKHLGPGGAGMIAVAPCGHHNPRT